ncbi:hypothetical protein J4458_02220 [Candidatus Woesearchaeota archaeon]|nr:hypothetical protein [Candidatus Woesearchaeota archaeon]
MKLKALIATLVIFAVFLSACDVYNTLYAPPAPVGEVVKIPEENITIGELIKEEAPVEKEAEKEEVKEVREEVGEATVIIVQETDIVSLTPKAQDPDKDELEFAFSSPLNEKGEWKTTYGDAGEYTVTVTVSDGELTSSKEVLIIVNKKEEAPVIESFMPHEKTAITSETKAIEFNVKAVDLNKDKISYEWKLDGSEVSGSDYFKYEITYDDAGSHTVKVTVSDGKLSTENLWSVTVNNVNRKPVLEEIPAIKVKETETVTIGPKAADLDGDEIAFTISDPVGNDGVWETTYDDSGTYTVKVTASDGTDEASQEVAVIVENVNRPPQIIDIVQE